MTEPERKPNDLEKAIIAHADCGHEAIWVWACGVCFDETIQQAEKRGREFNKTVDKVMNKHDGSLKKLAYDEGYEKGLEVGEKKGFKQKSLMEMFLGDIKKPQRIAKEQYRKGLLRALELAENQTERYFIQEHIIRAIRKEAEKK